MLIIRQKLRSCQTLAAAAGEVDQKKVANLSRLQMKKQQLERQKLQMQKQGKVPLNTEETAVEKKEEDERAKPTEMKLLKNKMRARGVKIAGEDPTPRNMKTYDDLDKGDVAEGSKTSLVPTLVHLSAG